MRIENGPYGSVGVISLQTGDTLLPHQLHVIENHLLDFVTSGFVRHFKGTTEICFDITGLKPLSDIRSLDWSEKEKTIAFCRFLRTFFTSEDHYLDLENFLYEEENIFVDMESHVFVWCYLPVKRAVEIKTTNENFEHLLNYLFFRNILSESQRLRFLHAFQQKNNNTLMEILDEIEEHVNLPPQKEKIHFLFFIFSFFVLYIFLTILEFFFPNFPKMINELSLFICLIGSVCVFFLLKKRERKLAALPEGVPKELFFPEDTNQVKDFNWPPMFLIHIEDEDKDKTMKKAVILTNEFLIGQDRLLCDYVLSHKSISEIHAKITRDSGHFFIADQNSDGGSWLKNQRLSPHRQYTLENNDIIRLGDISFLFSDGIEK